MSEEIEKVSAEIHKCYCRAYEKMFGNPYHTEGDYSKLDEPTKDYDREMARWHLEQITVLRTQLERYREALSKIVEVGYGWTGSGSAGKMKLIHLASEALETKGVE